MGDDTLTGGTGADIFVLQNGGGIDRITDFDATRVNGFAVDRLSVTGLTDSGGNPVNWEDVVVTDTVGDGSGDAVLIFPNGQTVILSGISPAVVAGQQNLVALGIPCFASGTPIRTPRGLRPVETLEKGDVVYTRDGGWQPILWCGASKVTRAQMEERPNLLPVRIRAGALGNRNDLRVSGQHGILMRLRDTEVLVRAIHLARFGFKGFRIAQGARSLVYHHVLLPRHGILDSDGLLSESFFPGPMAQAMLARSQRLQMAAIVCTTRTRSEGERVDNLARLYGPKARPVLTGKETGIAIRQGDLSPVIDTGDAHLSLVGRVAANG